MADPAFIKIENVTKKFGDFVAVNNVSLDIAKGELFALLGGSGCGKTTLLRMLAGFEMPTSGRIIIDGQDMSSVQPFNRPVNMMFQSYALFPHMSVEKNVGYGLKHENMTPTERTDRVKQLLELVQLGKFAGRKPHQLSGGQRQRVALARALAKSPKVLLLDEPLGVLDKKLREQTQFELMNIQEKLGITFIVVTHDQEEAMTLASRIAIMDLGVIKQVGTPTDVYEFPNSRFTADFIGSINLFDGEVESIKAGKARINARTAGCVFQADAASGIKAGDKVGIAVRPEKIAITRTKPKSTSVNAVQGEVLDLGYFGKDSLYRVKLPSGELIRVNRVNDQRLGESDRKVDWEDKVWLTWEDNSAIILAGEA
ncbi:MAG: ABC transporter ATP-binding protein [Anderseniella sp.]